MVMVVLPTNKTIILQTAHHIAAYSMPTMFSNDTDTDWFWIDWDVNFDRIRIGNSRFIEKPVLHLKFSMYFKDKLEANGNLFDYLNLAWDSRTGDCFGLMIVQLPPIAVEISKGCYDNFTKTATYDNTSWPTLSPTIAPAPTDNNDGAGRGDDGLSTASIVLLVIGCLILFAAMIGAGIVYYRRQGKGGYTDLIAEEIDIGSLTQKMGASDESGVGYVQLEDVSTDIL